MSLIRTRLISLVTVVIVALGVPSLASAAPGGDIREACGASFGQLVSAGRSSGTAFHTNYAGGAMAFSDPAVLAAHGCTL
ncbi:MAG TPA: hypothetical protein VF097_01905 [Actinomycetota bacterium]